MKKKKVLFSLMLLSLLAFGGCAGGMYGPVRGSIYTNVYGPVDYEPDSKNVEYSYEGMACATSYLGLVALGDASIDAAKRVSKVKNIVTVDYRVDGVLGLYARFCTVIHGY